MYKISSKNAGQLFFVFIVCLVLSFSPTRAYGETYPEQIEDEGAIIEVFEYLKEAHLSQPEGKQLLKGAIQGMIDTLEDPYTVYLSKNELDQLTRNLDGDYTGIGVYLEGQKDYPRIEEVFPDSPASRAGLQRGDQIIRVNGLDIKGLPLYDVVAKITGTPGSDLSLTIIRNTGQEITLALKRELLDIPTVISKVLGEKTGYMGIKSFGDRTPEHFESRLKDLLSQNITGLIIDLRDNPGGYINAAIRLSEIFLKENSLIVSTDNFDGSIKEYLSQERNPVEIPLVILVNSDSASASELMSGALRDNGKALLVGENTFGKGTAQSIIILERGGALKMTTSEYITPLGIHVDGKGLAPDYTVETEALQTFFALNLLEPQKKPVTYSKTNDQVIINDEIILSGRNPLLRNNRWYLPLRFTLELLGYTVKWDDASKKIYAHKDQDSLEIDILGNVFINEGMVKRSSGTIIENGVGYLSTGILEALGYSITENDEGIILGVGFAGSQDLSE
ncbi:MAG: PDZ domain-containing protein [Peptococcaceae bacterium]|nr:PDZ domain-containing protein [Peptococcaceae bacterium]